MRTIRFLLIAAAFIVLLPFACSDDDIVPPKNDTDPGILRTDEFGNILGGDSTDWCWKHGQNGFYFGPVYPNPVLGPNFTIKFGLPTADSVKIFLHPTVTDTVMLVKEILNPGSYQVQVNVSNYNFTNTYQRLYIHCRSFQPSDSCRYYGDIKFEE